MKPLVSRVLAFTRCTAVWFFAVLPFFAVGVEHLYGQFILLHEQSP